MQRSAIPQHILDRAAAEVAERNEALDACVADIVERKRCDAQLAPIWAEKLRYTFASMPETLYPDLVASSGGVLPIDTSVDPTALEWEYYMLDSGGFCDWIDEDGDIAPSTFIRGSRHTGKHAEHGGGYHWTIFDLERAAKVGLPLEITYAKADQRAEAEHTEWVWMFGDSAKELFGLCTHPNIPRELAAFNAGATSRLIVNKTDDEILEDFRDLIDSVPETTLELHHVKTVFMPHSFIREMRSRFIASTATGMVTLWDRLLSLYAGDASGQGKVEFKALLLCEAARRVNPKTGTDTSGISGDIMIALPQADASELCFIRSRPYTRRPPQEENFKVKVLTHSKIGGVKCVRPLSCRIVTYGTT